MSDQTASQKVPTAHSSKPTPSPQYDYQTYQGKSGSASAKAPHVQERQFAELNNLVIAN